MDCIFCKIIKGEIPAYTVYEDDIVKAFLDVKPLTNGDLLIIPKKHYENMMDIDTETLMYIQKIAKQLYPVLKSKLGIDGLTLVQNNDFGQEIKHYHLHVTPRYINDNFNHGYNKEILVGIEDVYEQLKD